MNTEKALGAGFTRVPHALLRCGDQFHEPLDFMVYLHLFTYSHGFGRSEAHMSQAQLERFTGAAKNTVKRSLERLVKSGWVRCVEEYECARMSRKWRVYAPQERGPDGKGKRGGAAGSNSDSVMTAHRPEISPEVSTAATLTVSNADRFLDNEIKEKSKKALSPGSALISEYFSELKPFAKRESEWKAYQGLRKDYSDQQVEQCLVYLREKGTPGSSARCHSPMGFLAKAMDQVWAAVEIDRERASRAEANARALNQLESQNEIECQAAVLENEKRESAFRSSYPDPKVQARVLAEFRKRFPILNPDGPAYRSLAIGAWWSAQSGLKNVAS